MLLYNVTHFEFALFMVLLGLLVLGFIALLLFIYFIDKQRKDLLYIGYLQTLYQQQLLFSTISYEELQKQRLSKQMHTNIDPHIIKLGVLINEIYFKAEKSSVYSAYDESKEELQQLMETTNRLSFDISPHRLEYLGLEESLKTLAEKYELQDHYICVRFQKSCQRLMPERERIIYRVIEELLLNTFKYSGAIHIFIVQKFKDSIYQIKLAHNGYGLEHHSYEQMLHQHSGLGLKRIASLMQAAKGTIKFCKEDHHYHVLLEFPHNL